MCLSINPFETNLRGKKGRQIDHIIYNIMTGRLFGSLVGEICRPKMKILNTGRPKIPLLHKNMLFSCGSVAQSEMLIIYSAFILRNQRHFVVYCFSSTIKDRINHHYINIRSVIKRKSQYKTTGQGTLNPARVWRITSFSLGGFICHL